MDLGAPLKEEAFRPLMTVLVPGAVAATPYVLGAGYRFPALMEASSSHTAATGLGLLFVFLAVGVTLDSVGALIESYVLDPTVEQETGCQYADWWEYLKLAPSPEPIAQGYLRTVLLHLKFELSMGLALILGWFGLLSVDASVRLLSTAEVVTISSFALALASYLLWESGNSARLLADLRHLMVHGQKCPGRDVKESAGFAAAFDKRVRFVGVVTIVAAVVILGSPLLGILPAQPTGALPGSLMLAFGITVFLTLIKLPDGRRASRALRIAYGAALAFLLVLVRVLEQGWDVASLVGLAAFGCAMVFFMMLRRDGMRA